MTHHHSILAFLINGPGSSLGYKL